MNETTSKTSADKPKRRRHTNLKAAMAKKMAEGRLAPQPEETAIGAQRTVTLRIPAMVHDQLRELAYTDRRSQHSFLMEALNLLFKRHGKPQIAPEIQ